MNYVSKEKVRFAAKQMLAWALRHKPLVIIALLLLYILFWPKSLPTQKVDDATAVPARTPAVSQTATTRPVAQQYAGDLPLYAPGFEGADPKWSLPIELQSSALQDLARQVDTLSRDIPATAELEGKCTQGVAQLLDERIANLYWSRIANRGFRDKKLPLDWYQVVKDQNSMVGSVSAAADTLATMGVQIVINNRLSSVRVRVIGGQVLVGDELFIKAAQGYVNQRKPYFEKLLPLMQSVANRTAEEFRAELQQPAR